MSVPQNNIWGPPLWNILHSLAERIYLPDLPLQIKEQRRLWVGLLSSLRLSLPCPLCRKHYTEYYNMHFPDTYMHNDFNQYVRYWLYQLHSDVNMRLSKQNIPIDTLTDTYGKYNNYHHDLNIVISQMSSGIRAGWINRDDLTRAHRFLRQLFAFYAI
jgi:hypothetical protein